MDKAKKFSQLAKAIISVQTKGYSINQQSRKNGIILNISKPGRAYVERDFDNQIGYVLSSSNKATYK